MPVREPKVMRNTPTLRLVEARERIAQLEAALRDLRGAALPIVDDGNTLQVTLDNLDKACCHAQDVLYLPKSDRK